MNTSSLITNLVVLIVIFIAFRFVRGSLKEKLAKPHLDRLARIRSASLIFSACLWAGVAISVYWLLGFLCGWSGFTHDGFRIVVSPNHVYSSPKDMPPAIFWLFMVKTGLGFFAVGMLLWLFRLYGKGVLFTAKNVNCIRFLGYYLVIEWFIEYQMGGLLRDMNLSTTPVFYGLFVIFFAWIMDEGRKMQEEQELTV